MIPVSCLKQQAQIAFAYLGIFRNLFQCDISFIVFLYVLDTLVDIIGVGFILVFHGYEMIDVFDIFFDRLKIRQLVKIDISEFLVIDDFFVGKFLLMNDLRQTDEVDKKLLTPILL